MAFLRPTREKAANDSKFLHVNNSSSRTPRPSRPPSPANSDRAVQAVNDSDSRRHRSLSASGSSKDGFFEMSERMKHTRDFKNKGFKGNSRGHFIQAPFTTLEEMFKKLPEHIGFNIEMSEESRSIAHETETNVSRRVSYAPRKRGARNGHLRCRTQLLRRHGSHQSL